MFNINKKSILITGGTGSFGNCFVKSILKKGNTFKRIVIYSRDEFKQYEMQKVFSKEKYPFIRFFLGDVRDYSRLSYALKDIDVVVHAAALKHVSAAEYDPFEFIKTNILGAENVVQASIKNNVKKVIALSTDKAVAPINLYGATKLCSDKLFLAANNITGKNPITFSIVRYGNVISSRGSVIPFFIEMNKNKKILPLTDPNMTRFHITLDQAINTVLWALRFCIGDEVIISKIPSIRILDIIKALDADYKLVGIRPGEKIHEELMQQSEAYNTLEIKDYFIITNKIKENNINYYKRKFAAKFVSPNFSYNSLDNNFLSIKQIKDMLK
jgi:UDP-N-acetylglucosamine 4,6-dehydratase